MEIPATTFAPVSKFRFGADVRDSEGIGGTLRHVVIAAESRAITAIGVRFGLFGRTIFAPVELVASATDDGVTLRGAHAEIEKAGKQPDGLRLGSDTPVSQGGKRLGSLEQVSFTSDTRALRHLVVSRGLGAEFVISAASVSQISSGGVALAAPASGARLTMTPFRPDAELREDALRAIESYNRLRVDLEGIHVTAIDGVIWLQGHVSSELNRRLVEDLVSGTHGLAELHNELLADSELAADVSAALGRDPRTTKERIGVYPILGEVRLRGAVHTASAREAAEQLATATPGVEKVVNELRVNSNANVLPVLASVTNNEDAVPGGR